MHSTIIAHPSFIIGNIDKRIYGGFIEHIGRVVYGGIWEPGSPTSNADGFRTDVAEEMQKLNYAFMRYPGGNFVSTYDWRNGIGPREKRPHRYNAAWRIPETNEFGTDEFMKFCHATEIEPMMSVNLGTGSPELAQELVEYCNLPGGTYWSDKRREYASIEPYNIKLWCLGNEMDGEWQAGFNTAQYYGARAREAAKLMLGVDPTIKLIGCGSSHHDMPRFGNWENESLEEMYDYIDYLSIHSYLRNPRRDPMHFFTKLETMSQFIDDEVSCCEFVRLRKRRKKRIKLCFDEWNVFRPHSTEMNKAPADRWSTELDRTDLLDALMTGGAMITLLNHADSVKLAAFAQPVNLTGLIETTPDGACWRQIAYYPSYYTARYGHGVTCRLLCESPHFEMDGEKYPYLYAAGTYNKPAKEFTIFTLNRHLTESLKLSADLCAFAPLEIIEAIAIYHDNLEISNDRYHEHVVPQSLSNVQIDTGRLEAELPPASWNMLRVKVEGCSVTWQASDALNIPK